MKEMGKVALAALQVLAKVMPWQPPTQMVSEAAARAARVRAHAHHGGWSVKADQRAAAKRLAVRRERARRKARARR